MRDEAIPEDDRLLDQAVEAARRALRRLDDEDVPAPLRRVASSSARRLPPPLRARLLRELQSGDWLRGRALDEWGEPDAGDDPGARASWLFLARPEGWEQEVASLGHRAARRDLARELEETSRERDRLARRVVDLEERLGRLEAERAATRARPSPRSPDEEWDRLRSRNVELRREVEALQAASQGAEGRILALARDLEEADRRIGDLRESLLKARRVARGEAEAGRTAFGRGSAVEMARALDDLHAALLPPPPGEGRLREPAPLAVPDGVRPDRAEAVEWLLGLDRPVTLLVDGYNVAHHLAEGVGLDTRRRLADELTRLRRLAEAPMRCLLFWDTSRPGERFASRGIDVRYVASADDAIVEEAGRVDRVVVVTGDREVRERCEASGAVALWSSALAEWIRR